jgi:ribose transport system substrate-binding protein
LSSTQQIPIQVKGDLVNSRKLAGAVLASAVLALAACSSGSSGSSGPGATSPGGGATAQAAASVAAAKAAVKAATTFPTAIPVTQSLPSKPPAGKTVVYLQCEQQECTLEGAGIKAAAAAIGWTYKVVNFQAANPATLVAALKTALQYKPVGVFFSGVPQQAWASVQQSYAKAGAFITENFDAKAPSGPGVAAGRGYADNSAQIGKLMADEQVANANGTATKALLVSVPSYPVFVPEAAAYQAEIAKTCPSCSVTALNVTLPQLLGGQLIPAIVSAVKRTPGISYIVSVNATFVTQLPSALAAAGLAGKFKIISGPSEAPDQQNVLNGTVLATVNSPYIMGGWQDVDMAIRTAMHLPIPAGDHVVPTVLLTKADVGTPQNSYDVPAGYAAQFKTLWHVSG